MVPLFAGVIIAGLGIGALLSAFVTRHSPAPVPNRAPTVVVHTPTPPAAVVAETAIASPTPLRSTASPAASPKPRETRKPVVYVSAKPAPLASATVTPSPSVTRSPSVAPSPSVTRSPSVAPSRAPAAGPSPSAAGASQRTSQSVAQAQAEESPAAALVRRYLEAAAHGNDAAASEALGGATDTEDQRYLNPSMRITSLTTSRRADDTTQVQVDFQTAAGQYFGTFTVDAGGKRILEHQLIPVGGTTAR